MTLRYGILRVSINVAEKEILTYLLRKDFDQAFIECPTIEDLPRALDVLASPMPSLKIRSRICRCRMAYASGFCAKLGQFVATADQKVFSHSEWLKHDGLQVYLRKSLRCFDGENRIMTLDVSNVGVKPSLRGKGRFRSFMDLAERLNPWDGIFVENVLEPRLEQFLRNRGYVLVETSLPDRCYYKAKESHNGRGQRSNK
jgi:hypothetical protein